MKNYIVISGGSVQLLSRTDDGTNTFYLNDTLIPSSAWVGSGIYTFYQSGVLYTFNKIDSLTGNIFLKQLDATSFEFQRITDTAATIDELNNRINQLATVNKTSITSFESNWKVYTGEANPVVKKQGSCCFLRGILTNISATTLTATKVKVFSIPSAYAPTETVFAVCNGSYGAKYLLSVDSSGSVYFERYTFDGSGNGSYPNIVANTWFPFSISWIIG